MFLVINVVLLWKMSSELVLIKLLIIFKSVVVSVGF